ncbi:MAG: hypothetical protein EOO88_32335 [Pedobacter sp.]|nr:MAG: hypothetical protein EOO88_32335 [Pedobacter sp.]
MKVSRLILTVAALLTTAGLPADACTCVRNNNWTIKDELNSVSLAVKGKVFSVTDYRDSESAWPQKLVKLVIEKKYKSPLNTPDTVSIIMGQDGATCGYGFKLGKEYIVYATNWEPKNTISKATAVNPPGMFYTSICRLTKESNQKELAQLNRLVH